MPKLAEFKTLIEEKKFYEAHEILEEFWFPRRKQKDKLTLIIKGFINAAVAFELQKRGRRENARKVWQTYIKFSKYIKESDKNLYITKMFIENYASTWL